MTGDLTIKGVTKSITFDLELTGTAIDPYGNILPCVALRRTVANILEIDSFEEVWTTSPVLAEVRGRSGRLAY